VLIDTHCHLAGTAFEEDLDAVLARAWEAGVARIVILAEYGEDAARALALADVEPRLSVSVGVHPHHADRWSDDVAAGLELLAADPRVVAVGEMGLDYHYEHSPRARQFEAFHAQLTIAERLGKPAVIHAREADADVADILRAHPGTCCILHSFSSGAELHAASVALGHYISFSGMATFKSWTLDDLVRTTPADRLLIETDGPFLAPVPLRGKRNEPAFVGHTAARLAAVRGLTTEAFVALTGSNAGACFGRRLT